MAQRNFPHTQTMPPPIMGSEEGSFAYFTVTLRLPEIAKRVIAENNFTPEVVRNLETLANEVNDGFVRSLKDTEGPDLAAWSSYLEPYLGRTWLDIPWYFAEAYFYRRILEATNYFLDGVDPFEYQKRLGLDVAKDAIVPLSKFVNQWQDSAGRNSEEKKAAFIKLLYFDLWGNRADLSLWPAGRDEENRIESNREKSYILVDDSDAIASKISTFQTARIDFIVDNAGFELVGDLCVADFLLSTKTAETVYLHLKAYPTFVSDAMIKDVIYTVNVLAKASEPDVQAYGLRLQNYIDEGRLQLRENLFWTSPLAFWEMPDSLDEELSQSALIFIKGDANYRRTMGDRHWNYTTPYQDIVSYFPASFVALRTLKSEVAAGLKPEQIEMLNDREANWLTNGQWGVIQLVEFGKINKNSEFIIQN